MTRHEHQSQQIVFDVVVQVCGVEIRHGHVLLRLQLATEFLVLALEQLVATKVIDGAMLRGGHEPRARIVRNARLRPPLQRDDQRVLRELFGHTHVADDPRQPGDQPGRLDPPDSIDSAMGISDGHGDPSSDARSG